MSRVALLGLILTSVLLNASAQILLRWGARRTEDAGGPAGIDGLLSSLLSPGVIAGLTCYGLSVLAWLQVLSRADASFAYPFLGLGFAVVAVAGWWILGEPMTARRIAGTIVIMAGVFLLASDQG